MMRPKRLRIINLVAARARRTACITASVPELAKRIWSAEGRPVVVFLHAWGAPNPQAYGSWIDHLARTGSLVIFPRFQDLNRTRPSEASASYRPPEQMEPIDS